MIRATLAASTRRVDDGAVAVGRAKVESFVVSMSHSDAGHVVARGVPVASSTAAVSDLSAVEQEQQRLSNERAAHAPIELEELMHATAVKARPKRRALRFEPERWVKAKFSKGDQPAEWFFGQLIQRQPDGSWKVTYQNGETEDTPVSSLHLVNGPPEKAGEHDGAPMLPQPPQLTQAPQPPQPPQLPQPPQPPQPLQQHDEVKPEDQTDSTTSKYGNRKLFTRKEISEVLGGNFMHAPWVPTNAAGKGKDRSPDEPALLQPRETYVVETYVGRAGSTWAPFQPKAAMEPGALRHWDADQLRAAIANGEGRHQQGALSIIDPPAGQGPASFEFFAGRQAALYEYCGRYVMQAHDEECEYEDPKNFSEERVQHLLSAVHSHGRLDSNDPSYVARMSWIMDKNNWRLRPIRAVSYTEELYRRLSGL